MAVKIARRVEPTGEQLAASVILTGASALRMMRAERRHLGHISWRDFHPDEERRVLPASTCEICTRGANDDLTLNFSLNLAIMRYVPARLWLRTGMRPSKSKTDAVKGIHVSDRVRAARSWRVLDVSRTVRSTFFGAIPPRGRAGQS